MNREDSLLNWAVELQSLAQAGLYYSKDPFDRERFQRIREISAEMVAHRSGLPLEQVTNLFCCEVGYQTPKLDTRSAVFRNEKILLVQENNGLWSLPGGWVDIGLTVAENAVKETREEAGVDVLPRKIIAVVDWQRSNDPGPSPYSACKVFVLCDLLGGSFEQNIETISSGWFAQDELPPLCREKNTPEQIQMCFQAAQSPVWEPVFQ